MAAIEERVLRRTSAGAAGVGEAPSLPRSGLLIVAQHRQPAGGGGPRPWGTTHVKRIGSPATVCGTPTHSWNAFWHLSVAEVTSWCHECRRELGRWLR